MIEMQVSCPEPAGPVLRTVRQMSRDPKEVLEVFDRLKSGSSFLVKTGPAQITELLNTDAIFYLVDDCGIIAVYPGEHEAHVHITFWDRRLRGREQLCREVAKMILGWGLNYLWTVIPKESRATLAFAKRVGFRPFTEYDGLIGLMLTAQELT